MADILKSAQEKIDTAPQQTTAPAGASPPTDPMPSTPSNSTPQTQTEDEAPTDHHDPADPALGDLHLPYSSRQQQETPSHQPEDQLPTPEPVPLIPPPVAKKRGSKSLILAVLLFLLATIPLAVYFTSQQRQLADLRGRAQEGPYPNGNPCNSNSSCASGYCDGPSGICKDRSVQPTSPPEPPNSFLAGTDILTPYGNVPIEDINEGDTVLSFHPLTKDIQTSTVSQVFSRISDHYYHIELDDQTVLNVTEYHPIYRGTNYKSPFKKNETNTAIPYYEGFELVKNLQIGDTVFITQNNTTIHSTNIKIVERISTSVRVYNLYINGTNTYFAQRVAVHNKGALASPIANSTTTNKYGFTSYSDCIGSGVGTAICTSIFKPDQVTPYPTSAPRLTDNHPFNTYAECMSEVSSTALCKALSYPGKNSDPLSDNHPFKTYAECMTQVSSTALCQHLIYPGAKIITGPGGTTTPNPGVHASIGTDCDDYGTGTQCHGEVTIHVCPDGPTGRNPGPICINPLRTQPGDVDCVALANQYCAFVQLDTPNGSGMTCYPTSRTQCGKTPTVTQDQSITSTQINNQPGDDTSNPPPGGSDPTATPTSPPPPTATLTPTPTLPPGGTCELIKVYDSSNNDITLAVRDGTKKLAIGEEVTIATTKGNATRARFRIQGIADWAENDPSKTTSTEFRLSIHIPSTLTQAQGTFEVEVFVNGQWK